MSNVATISERVAEGAAWLDSKRPGWHDDIDLGLLDMTSTCLCVLGQVYAGAAGCNGFDYAGDLGAPVTTGGFDLPWHGPGTPANHAARLAEFGELDAAWRALIEHRRAS